MASNIAFEDEVSHFLKFTGAETLEPNAIFIMVMGMTGAGKSTFISRCTGEAVEIGHDLRSCTQSLAIYSFRHGAHTVYLIDTPGFDDTSRSDVETLRIISHYLGVSYANRVYIGGIVYLHRVSDNRMTGTSRRNISMFKALCGDATYSNVAIATTMWTADERQKCLFKEQQLFSTEDWFGGMCGPDAARPFRHAEYGSGTEEQRTSALAIVSHLIETMRPGPVILQIQSELVDEKRSLEDTSAGRILLGEIAEARRGYQEQLNQFQNDFSTTLADKDAEMLEAISRMREEGRKDLEAAERQRQALKDSLIQMHQTEEQRLLRSLEVLERGWKFELESKAQELQDFKDAMEEQRRIQDAERHDEEAHRDALARDRQAKREQALQQERLYADIELAKLRKELKEVQSSVEKKEEAGGKVRSALASGLMSGMSSGIASGVIALAVPVLCAGLMCNLM